MAKLILSDLSNLQNEVTAVTTINANNTTLETALEKTLSRDGTSPNTMSASLDMNSNSILNLPDALTAQEPVTLSQFEDALEGLGDLETTAAAIAADADTAATAAVSAASSASSATTSASSATTSASSASTSATAAAASATVVTGDKYTYESSTSMAAPATGGIRFNNATVPSATAIAVNASSAASGNPDISDWIVTWDDSTNTTVKGNLLIRKIGTPATWAEFEVTAVTDNTTWLQLTVQNGVGSGTWSAADSLSIQFSRAGNKGADGAGVGDVTGPASATDNAIVRFDSTTGKLIQNSAVTIADTTGVTTGMVFPNTGLNVQDTNASHNLNIKPGSDLTADRILTLTTGDAARTFTLTADSSIGGTAYVGGGTDVAVADGGTGVSTAVLARGSTGLNIESLNSVGDVNYSILTTDRVLRVSAALTAPRTWTLPAVSSFAIGQTVKILIDFASAVTAVNTITIAVTGGDTITPANPGPLTSLGLYTFISLGGGFWSFESTSLTHAMSGNLAIANGGTGATTAANAFTNLKQDATTSATGVVELATNAETLTGTDTVRAVTPAGITGLAACFLAHKNGTNQTLSNTTETVLTFGTEYFDVGSYYDTSTSRWTPPAGRVALFINMRWTAGVDQAQHLLEFRKNGAEFARVSGVGMSGTSAQGMAGCVVAQANGTDYFEIWGYQGSGGNMSVDGAAAYTTFGGTRLS